MVVVRSYLGYDAIRALKCVSHYHYADYISYMKKMILVGHSSTLMEDERSFLSRWESGPMMDSIYMRYIVPKITIRNITRDPRLQNQDIKFDHWGGTADIIQKRQGTYRWFVDLFHKYKPENVTNDPIKTKIELLGVLLQQKGAFYLDVTHSLFLSSSMFLKSPCLIFSIRKSPQRFVVAAVIWKQKMYRTGEWLMQHKLILEKLAKDHIISLMLHCPLCKKPWSGTQSYTFHCRWCIERKTVENIASRKLIPKISYFPPRKKPRVAVDSLM
ncbi:MAG: hypothetical protein ACTSUE_07545 [Promethearchaeota archaeon]